MLKDNRLVDKQTHVTMGQKTHQSVTVARDGVGGGQALAAGASGPHRNLDGATCLEWSKGEETIHDSSYVRDLNVAENMFHVKRRQVSYFFNGLKLF